MKKLLILSMLAVFVSLQVQAQITQTEQIPQSQEESVNRNLRLMVRNARGKVMYEFPAMVTVKGTDVFRSLDDSGDLQLSVVDADTVAMQVGNTIYEFPVAGIDTLHVVFKNRNRISGIYQKEGLVDGGYTRTRNLANLGAASEADLQGIETFPDLRSYMLGRVAGVQFLPDGTLLVRGTSTTGPNLEPLVVVDGVPAPSFSVVNESITPSSVQSLTVLKDAGATSMYGVQGANGVVVIRTKTGSGR